ncbi:MAG: radical SAM protein [Candidatus Aenigmatarchaeota archaeon]
MGIKERSFALAELGSEMVSCSRRRISNVQLFATNKCNSKCNICSIWSETPKTDIDLGIVRDILKAKSIEKNALYGLVGGEFILHEKAEEIIGLFNKERKRYVLFSNCILTDRLIKIVKEQNVPSLMISLDGDRETYRRVRGVDKYENVMRAIKELKGGTKITITYVINSLNSRNDFIHVKNIAEKNRLGLCVVVYDRRAIFNTKLNEEKSYDLKGLYSSNYMDSYYRWKSGSLNLPCFSIRTLLTVMPNGDVPLCQQKNEILGNLHERKLDDIWKAAAEKQDKNKDCNGCWVSCYRSFDNNACRLLNTVLPQFALDRLVGKYGWKNIGKIYGKNI